MPPALGGLERRLMLMQMVGKWAAAPAVRGAGGIPLVAQTPAAACALADDLARLIDDMTMRGVAWDKLDGLVPDVLDPYWQLTLKFLQIAREAWPALLRERGLIEPAARRDALIKAEAARLARRTDAPVIAAGSTGSIPATAELIATIARLPHGAVVLPGLDTDLDEASWRMIAGDAANDIAPAPGTSAIRHAGAAHPHRDHARRRRTLAEAKGRERLIFGSSAPGGDGRPVVGAAPPIRHSGRSRRSAPNISHDRGGQCRRGIARHRGRAARSRGTRARRRRWSRLTARWRGACWPHSGAGISRRKIAAEKRSPTRRPGFSLALRPRRGARPACPGPLARPCSSIRCCVWTSNGRAVAALERAVLRGPRPRPGSDGLAHALQAFRTELEKFRRKESSDLHPSDPRVTLGESELAGAADLVVKLGAALLLLEGGANRSHRLSEIVARHRDVVAALSRQGGHEAAFAGADGAKLAEAFDELASSEAAANLVVDASDYAELFAAVLVGLQVRPPPQSGARVRILGTVEARLTDIDRVVLGGLVEGTWPPESRSDAWLSRPMRQQLGLDQPERRVGLSAHDFAQMLGAREVILSHSAKVAGTPTVPSRFVQRLAAIAGARWQTAVDRGGVYLAWARELDRPQKVVPAPQPAPKPPRAARPKRLSVTAIEDWLRDPYTIYAKYILRLAPLDPVDMPPGAAERGTIIHNAVGDFTQRYANALPDNPAAVLIELGKPHFAPLEDFPETSAFWWPRFVRIAHWFAAWEGLRRPDIKAIAAEISGQIDIPLKDGVFKLTGRADRIERHADRRYVILDYKTGSARTEKQVRTGLAPQLTLEAAILRGGGFKDIAGGQLGGAGRLCAAQGWCAARRAEADRIRERDDRQPSRSRAPKARRAGPALRR